MEPKTNTCGFSGGFLFNLCPCFDLGEMGHGIAWPVFHLRCVCPWFQRESITGHILTCFSWTKAHEANIPPFAHPSWTHPPWVWGGLGIEVLLLKVEHAGREKQRFSQERARQQTDKGFPNPKLAVGPFLDESSEHCIFFVSHSWL